jgi:regulatory protein
LVITSIESQKKKQKEDRKRYNIFIDGEFAFGLYEETILKFDLHTHREISEELVNRIREKDEYEFAKRAAFDYLSYRIRSESEIRKKLKQKKISLTSIDKVIDLLMKLNMINDVEFSKQLINDKVNRKPVGKKVLQQKLFEKGIDKETREKVIEEFFNENDEFALAGKALTKYLTKLKDEDPQIKRKKCFEYLARKGFDFEIISELLYKLNNGS